MIYLESSFKYCKYFTQIENYDKAIADKHEHWVCHHRLEQVFTQEELERAGWYYDRKPQELIYLPISFHHNNPDIHISVRRHFLQKKQKKLEILRELYKIEVPKKPRKFGPHSEEHKMKISESMKGHKVSEETRNKISKANKGKCHSKKTEQRSGIQRKDRWRQN